jgi:hypothetical protein
VNSVGAGSGRTFAHARAEATRVSQRPQRVRKPDATPCPASRRRPLIFAEKANQIGCRQNGMVSAVA